MSEMNDVMSPEAGSVLESRHNLGILYHEESGKGLSHPFFVLILDEFKNEAEARGYDVTLINHQDKESILEHCRYLGLNGVCMVCWDFADPRVIELTASGFPCVSVDHMFKRIPSVLSDNESGVQKLIDFAISRGHKRIAFVHGHNNSLVTRTRISQFFNNMSFYGLPVPEAFIRESLYHDITLTRNIVRDLLTLKEPPTCILLPDDMTYLGAQEAAWELGLRIPDDISFAGYDGIPLMQTLSPRLTTIRQNCVLLGKTAADRLMDLIENPGTASRRPSIFPVELLEGETICTIKK